jgi:hypothetical protein
MWHRCSLAVPTRSAYSIYVMQHSSRDIFGRCGVQVPGSIKILTLQSLVVCWLILLVEFDRFERWNVMETNVFCQLFSGLEL